MMKLTVLPTLQLNLTEIFTSVQGETGYTGFPTTFVRLAACNLRCSWCDTPYSFPRGKSVSFDEIHKSVSSSGFPHVCVTGGEPLLQEAVYPFMTSLCDLGYIVTIETGGSLPTDKIDPRVVTILDIKCPGSNMSQKNYWKNLESLREHDEVKFVLLNKDDYEYAIEICRKYSLFDRSKPPLFSPVHNKLDPKHLVEWIIEDQLPVRLNLQIHKYIWSPDTKGV